MRLRATLMRSLAPGPVTAEVVQALADWAEQRRRPIPGHSMWLQAPVLDATKPLWAEAVQALADWVAQRSR
jgi:hypothetical protein